MDAGDTKEFATALTGVAEIYGREVTPALIRIWFRAMREFSIDQVRAAFDAHWRDPDGGRFFPTPAHILGKLTTSYRDRALLAWGEQVLPMLSNSRAARSDDPAVEAAVRDLGGWVHLGQLPTDELRWRERDFLERYELHASQAERAPALQHGARSGIGHAGGIAGAITQQLDRRRSNGSDPDGTRGTDDDR